MKNKIREALNKEGAASIYIILISLLALQFILTARSLLVENYRVSIEKKNYVDIKVEIENLEEHTKIISYLIMEKAVEESLEYAEKLSNDGVERSEEEISRAYYERLKFYNSQAIRGGGHSLKPRDIAYIEGFLESSEKAYEYDSDFQELFIKAEDISDSEYPKYHKKYNINYIVYESEDSLGQTLSSVNLIMEYPSYREALLYALDKSRIRMLKQNH